MIRQMFTKVGAAVKVIGSTSWIRLGVSLGKNQETFGKKKTGKITALRRYLLGSCPFRRVKPQTFLLEVPCSTLIEIS